MAAAAALVLWVVAPRDRTPQGAIDPSPVAALAALRDTLTADGVARTITWRAAGDPTGRGATGDVTWHAVRQAGVMRFVGLAPNEAHRWQYQLWIFDRRRDQRYPVDGGVFDVPDGAREVLVRIDPRVPVGEAVAFAVTVEPAGGVVVSTRERVALLADGAE
jgi:anti-sigma-K factor RskA